MANHTASDVARWLLQRNNIEMKLRDSEYISHLKLQKLLYYAQGVFLGIYGEKLFNENILAWEHGPVVEEVYQEYKNYKSRGIDDFTAPIEEYTPQEEEVLEMVYDNFAQYSASKLRNMTHAERPWLETLSNNIINPSLICDFFKEEYIDNG